MSAKLVRPWVMCLLALSLTLAACAGGEEAAESSPTPADEPPPTTEDGDAPDPETTPDDSAETEAAAEEADPTEAAPEEGFTVDGDFIAEQAVYEAAQGEGPLLIYSGWPEEGQRAILSAFEEDTGLPWELVRLASGRLYERIVTEHGGDQLEADAIFIADIALTNDLVERGIFMPHTVPNHDEIPDNLKQEDGLHYAALNPCYGIMYNTELVSEDEAPTAWADLTDETWSGRLALLPPDVGGGGWATWLTTRQSLGIEFWEAMAAQDSALYTSTVPLTEDIVRGEVAVGMGHIGTALGEKASGAPIEVVFPEDGPACYSIYLGISETTQNPNVAEVFLNWSMSRVGQEAMAEAASEYPAHPEAELPLVAGEELPPADVLNFADEEDWVELRDEWIAEWNEMFDYVA